MQNNNFETIYHWKIFLFVVHFLGSSIFVATSIEGNKFSTHGYNFQLNNHDDMQESHK